MNPSPTTGLVARLTRPIIGIENRTAEEAFDIMADRIRSALSLPTPTVDREAIALAEEYAAKRDWNGAYCALRAAILSLLHPIDDMGSGGAD